MSLDPTGKGRKRWTNRWKAALNAFDITFDGRLSAGTEVTTKIELHRKIDRPSGDPPSGAVRRGQTA